jgi:hypothetical protein
MCNLYSMTRNQAAIIELAPAMRDTAGNLAPAPHRPGGQIGSDKACLDVKLRQN